MSKTPATGGAPQATTPAHPPARHPPTRSRRKILMLAGPIVAVAVAAGIWIAGGRYVATDNAYVKADKLNLAADIAGYVVDVQVREGEMVRTGQPLFRLDDQIYRIALTSAEAQLDLARNQIMTTKAQVRSGEAQIAQVRADLDYFRLVNDRQSDLAGRGIATQSLMDSARRDYDSAQARLAVAERQVTATLAQLGGDASRAVDDYPSVRAAAAQVERARRDLAHTVISAPYAGVVTNVASLQIGQYLAPAQAALSLVSTDRVWVEANPKESDLTYLKEGNGATVTIDSYPGAVLKGRVASISPATGGEFAVLPAQNTSGNWVKVVQRITVRVALDLPKDAPRLRPGMSAAVSIDTGHIRHIADLVTDLKHLIGA